MMVMSVLFHGVARVCYVFETREAYMAALEAVNARWSA